LIPLAETSEELFKYLTRDNGRGISEEEKSRPESLGLLGMRERVSLIGGRIEITGVEGEGTVVTVLVSLLN
jgi:signal transduction histidine kinase